MTKKSAELKNGGAKKEKKDLTKIQSRNWCFTDFSDLQWESIYVEFKDIIRYIAWGEEICPKTQRLHYQGWIQFFNKKRMSEVKRLCGSKKLHLEPRRGNAVQNDKYCAKDGKFINHGKFVKQGERTDLEMVKKKICDGATMKDIADGHFGSFCQYGRQFYKYKEMIDKEASKEFRHVEVTLLRGTTGAGKTRLAMESCINPYKIEGDQLQWWDGYDGETELVIDEYANQINITKMLSLLDGYRLRIPIKGGFTYARWTKIYITTNLWELHSQAQENHRAALYRRITKIIDFE